MKNWMFVMALAFCGSAFGQEPVITDPSVETLPSARCAELTQQILAKQASIAYLDTVIASATASMHAAETDWANAIAAAYNNPLWQTYYEQIALFHFAKIVYWTGEVSDAKFLKSIKQTELDALSLEHTLLDC